MRRLLIPVIGALLAGVVLVAAPASAGGVSAGASSAAPTAWDDRTGKPLRDWGCDQGNVCFWNDFDGRGKRCTWDIADPDWTSGAVKCSWAATDNVHSVMNLGQDPRFSGVAFYRGTNYANRAGCTGQQKGGNLAGTYQLRSHQWVTGNCG